jgi:ABC-type transporter Mla MlaB component
MIRLALGGPMAAPDVAALCEDVRVSLDRRRVDLVICDLGALTDADLGTIDALARLQLTSRRLGSQMGVRNAPAGLRDLLLLVGLAQVVRLRVEASGQAEEREEALGVQEEGDPADPAT